MATSLTSVLTEAFQDQMVEDSEVDNWFLMPSWIPITTMVASYLIFVIYLGPKWMETRPPFQLRKTILAYNFLQVLINVYILSMMFTSPGAITYLYKHSCMPLPRKTNPLWPYFTNGVHFYYMTKILDMLDTIFFVLRKKKSQITFLHVYHHSTMAISTWFFLRYFKAESTVYSGYVNSLVHVFMYSYFFLSAMGPQVQKYLWWKKHVTQFQLAQFVFFLIHNGSLIVFNCDQPTVVTCYTLSQALIMILLFSNFYNQTYMKKRKSS